MREGALPDDGPDDGAEGASADDQDPTASPAKTARSRVRAAREIAVLLAAALLVALLIKTFLAQAFFIPSGSMEQTLLVGDRVLVSKLTPKVFDLHRGDVVVFTDPGGWLEDEGVAAEDQSGPVAALRNAVAFVGLLPQDGGDHFIKRVIGLPGDHVTCCDAGGRVTVNGVAIDERPYLDPGESAADSPCESTYDVTVPSGGLWVLGDNRAISADSRCHQGANDGTVPVRDVVGKAFVVVWPIHRVGGLQVPAAVFRAVPPPRQVFRTPSAPPWHGPTRHARFGSLGPILEVRADRRTTAQRRVGGVTSWRAPAPTERIGTPVEADRSS